MDTDPFMFIRADIHNFLSPDFASNQLSRNDIEFRLRGTMTYYNEPPASMVRMIEKVLDSFGDDYPRHQITRKSREFPEMSQFVMNIIPNISGSLDV